ncbi:MAG: hypothetical protein HQM10_16640 [Candidatus Riflebacteria bacterium]|nr:hypothetical protein [Candidatus Riflebacteria bacterium]
MSESQNNQNQICTDIEKRIDAKIAKIRWNRNVTVLMSILFLVTFCGYFSLLSIEMSSLTQPEDVANIISVQVFDFLLNVIGKYGVQVVSLAPEVAESATKDFISRIPQFREEVQVNLVAYMEDLFSSLENVLDRFFEIIYRRHRNDIKVFLTTIQTPQGQKGFEDFLVNIISAPLSGEKAKLELASIEELLSILNLKLHRLVNEKTLIDEEKVEREVLFSVKEFFDRKSKEAVQY